MIQRLLRHRSGSAAFDVVARIALLLPCLPQIALHALQRLADSVHARKIPFHLPAGTLRHFLKTLIHAAGPRRRQYVVRRIFPLIFGLRFRVAVLHFVQTKRGKQRGCVAVLLHNGHGRLLEHGLGVFFGKLVRPGRNARLQRVFLQKPQAYPMHGAYVRASHPGGHVAGPLTVQSGAKTLLQLGRSLAGKCDRNDFFRHAGSASPLSFQRVHVAPHQIKGLAGSRAGPDDQFFHSAHTDASSSAAPRFTPSRRPHRKRNAQYVQVESCFCSS